MRDEVLESLGVYSPEDGAMKFNNAVSEMRERGELANWSLERGRPRGDTSFLTPAARSSEAKFSYNSSGDALEIIYSVRPRVKTENDRVAPLDTAKRLNSDIEEFNIAVDLRYVSGSEPMFEQIDKAFEQYVGERASESFRVDHLVDQDGELVQTLDPNNEGLAKEPHRRTQFDFDYEDWKKA